MGTVGREQIVHKIKCHKLTGIPDKTFHNWKLSLLIKILTSSTYMIEKKWSPIFSGVCWTMEGNQPDQCNSKNYWQPSIIVAEVLNESK